MRWYTGLSLVAVVSFVVCAAIAVIVSAAGLLPASQAAAHAKRGDGIGAGVLLGPEFRAFPALDAASNLTVVIAVRSQATDAALRAATRSTWFQLVDRRHVAPVFVVEVGSVGAREAGAVLAEAREHGDVLAVDASGSSARSGDAALLFVRWLAARAPRSVAHLVRCGGDVFLRADEVVKYLAGRQRIYAGDFVKTAKRTDDDKNEYYLEDMPAFAHDDLYVLSRDLVDFVASLYPLVKTMSTEERSVGVWMSPVDVDLTHDQRFAVAPKDAPCSKKTAFGARAATAQDVKDLWGRLKDKGALCV
eukprot:m51a1_g9436 hypothetical protein (305) ;mRNA; f:440438-441558